MGEGLDLSLKSGSTPPSPPPRTAKPSEDVTDGTFSPPARGKAAKPTAGEALAASLSSSARGKSKNLPAVKAGPDKASPARRAVHPNAPLRRSATQVVRAQALAHDSWTKLASGRSLASGEDEDVGFQHKPGRAKRIAGRRERRQAGNRRSYGRAVQAATTLTRFVMALHLSESMDSSVQSASR